MTTEACPNCGSPWMEGTGLYLCGEGVAGNVHGGCRVPYTAERIRSLAARVLPVSGVYAVQVGPDISDDPIRWCFANEIDADAFAKALGQEAWVTFEPVALTLDDPALADAFGEDIAEAKRIAASS